MGKKIRSISKTQILAIILLVVGLVIAFRYGKKMLDSYRELEYARQHSFDDGNPDPDLIRPWMDMAYIGVAYAVPQEYLFNELDIPMNRENSRTPLNSLNRKYDLGFKNDRPALLTMVRDVILKYRENPVITGLEEEGVRNWMSIQYISNSTGIPVETILSELDISTEEHIFIPLYSLNSEINYPGGEDALVEAIQQIVDKHEGIHD